MNKLYHVPLAPSKEFASQILNSMHRELKNRNGEAKPVEGLYTRECPQHRIGREGEEEEEEVCDGLRSHRQNHA